MLYTFDGNAPGLKCLQVESNDIVEVIKDSDSEGWSRARKLGSDHFGFIPTSYFTPIDSVFW